MIKKEKMIDRQNNRTIEILLFIIIFLALSAIIFIVIHNNHMDGMQEKKPDISSRTTINSETLFDSDIVLYKLNNENDNVLVKYYYVLGNSCSVSEETESSNCYDVYVKVYINDNSKASFSNYIGSYYSNKPSKMNKDDLNFKISNVLTKIVGEDNEYFFFDFTKLNNKQPAKDKNIYIVNKDGKNIFSKSFVVGQNVVVNDLLIARKYSHNDFYIDESRLYYLETFSGCDDSLVEYVILINNDSVKLEKVNLYQGIINGACK